MAEIDTKVAKVVGAAKEKRLGAMPTLEVGASPQEISDYEAAMTTWLTKLDELYDECLAEERTKFLVESEGRGIGKGPR
jgi:hypothetical protein